MKRGSLFFSAFFAILSLPVLVLAAGGNFGGNATIPPPPGTIDNITANDVVKMIKNLTNWFAGIVLILAVLTMLTASFVYLISGGNEKKTQLAKKIITYTIVAIVIVALAYGIVSLVTNTINDLKA